MKAKVYILIISYMQSDGSYDYRTVYGVYEDRKVAVAEAKKRIQAQQSVWDGCRLIKHNGCAVRLMGKDGCCKWYEIEEQTIR